MQSATKRKMEKYCKWGKLLRANISLLLYCTFMSVGWDVKWCSGSRITTLLARKTPFHWISMKSRLVRAAREIKFHNSKFHNWLLLTDSRRRYLAEILPMRCKNLSNQSINQSLYFFTENFDDLIQNTIITITEISQIVQKSKHSEIKTT